jgi:hypothetical protein
MAEHDLGAELDHAGTARMIPAGAPGSICRLATGSAAGFQRGKRIGLGVEDADRIAIAGPVTAAAGEARGAAADAAGNAALIFRRVALIGRADLEQRDIADAMVGIALRGGEQARQQRRAHVAHVGGNRIGELQFAAAAEQFACSAGMNDQETDSIMPRTASARLARRVRICSVVRIFALTAPMARQGLRAMLFSPWMRMTSSTRSALPSTSYMRQDGTETSTRSPEPETPKPRPSGCRSASSLDATERPVSRLTSAKGNSTTFLAWPL